MNIFKVLVLLFFLNVLTGIAYANDFGEAAKNIFGNDSKNKFTYYHPTYFIFGKDDLKLQFSGKYRVANNFNLYLGYTQKMLWSIYYTSQPFKDINYNPEIFYRLVDDKNNVLKSLDLGFIHTSNGKDSDASRSLSRVYVKTNLVANLGRHNLIWNLMFYQFVSKEENNSDIKEYMGFWDLSLYLTDLIVYNNSRLNFEFRIFAGDKVFNINKGGRSFGLVYDLGSQNFNPQIYLQYYSGHVESLLDYNKTSDQLRLGLLLFL